MTEIAITGANGLVGRMLIPALLRGGHSVTGLVRRPADDLGAPYIADWMNDPRALDMLDAADVIIHLCGSINPQKGNSYKAAQIDTATRVVHGVSRSHRGRILYLGGAGARVDADNAFYRTMARTEAILEGAGLPVTIFQSTAIIGPPDATGDLEKALLSADGKSVGIFGNGRQRLRPIYRGDVVVFLLAALDGPAGRFEIAGPSEYALDELVGIINGGTAPKISHVPPPLARLIGLLAPGLNGAFVDAMLKGSLADPDAAVRTFGVSLTDIESIWGKEV